MKDHSSLRHMRLWMLFGVWWKGNATFGGHLIISLQTIEHVIIRLLALALFKLVSDGLTFNARTGILNV
jgi:hypothetical protein